MEVTAEVEEGPEDAKGFQQFNLQNSADEVRTLPPTVQSHQQSNVATSQVQLFPTVQPSQHNMDTDGQPVNLDTDVGTDWCRERVVTQNKRQPSATNSTAQTTGSDGTITVTDRGVLPLWRTIGEWKKLATDADIARFLLSLYFNPKLAETQSDSRCVHCSTPLTMCCITCLLSAKQPAPSQSSSSGKSHLSQTSACTQGKHSESQVSPSSEDEMEADFLCGNDGEEEAEDCVTVKNVEVSEDRSQDTQARNQWNMNTTPVVLLSSCDSKCASNQSVTAKGKVKRQRPDSRSVVRSASPLSPEAESVPKKTRRQSVESLRHRGSARPGGETEDIASSDPLKGDLGSANSTASLKIKTESHSAESTGSLPVTEETERERYPICDGKPFKNGDIPAFKHFSEYQCSRCDRTFQYKHLIKRHMKKPDCDTGDEFVQHSTGGSGSVSVKKQAEKKKYPICDGKPFRNGSIPVNKHFSEYKCSKCDKTFKYKKAIQRHMKNPDCDTGGGFVQNPISPDSKPVETVGDNDWTPSDHDHADDCDEVGKSAISKEHKQNHSVFQSNKEYTIEDFMTGKLQIPGGYKYTGNTIRKRSYKSLSHYSCEQCHKVFVSEITYKSHQRDHLKESKWGTSQSHTEPERKGPDPESLRILTEIKERRLHCCPHCSRIFMSKLEHRLHVRSHTFSVDDEDNHTCHFCGASLKNAQLLKRHQAIPKKERVCQQCGLYFEARCIIKKHMKKHIEENEKCGVCGESFDSLTKMEIKQHLKTHKQMQPTSLCPLCGKSVQSVKKHMKTHSDQKPFSCAVCSKTYKSITGLQKHELQHGEKTLQCEICGEYFYHESQLERHRSYKHLKQVFECKECGKQLSMKRILENHIRIVHRKVKPYVCSVCGCGHDSRAGLKMHMRMHTGEKPFPCPHCPSRFSRRDYMQQHVRTHTGERPYGCDDCGQRFTCRASLKLHRRNHHSDNIFPCSQCGETFPLQSSLDFHRYNVHGGSHPSMAEETLSAAVEDITQEPMDSKTAVKSDSIL